MGYPRDNHGIAIANSIVGDRGDLPTSSLPVRYRTWNTMAFYTRHEGSPRRLHRERQQALLQNILIIPLSAFQASSETRPAGIIIVIMRLQELGMRIVRRATI